MQLQNVSAALTAVDVYLNADTLTIISVTDASNGLRSSIYQSK